MARRAHADHEPDDLEAYIEERITTSNYKVTDCGMLLWVPSAKAAAQYMAHARAKAKAVAPPPKAPNATTACKTEVQAPLPCPPKPSSNVQAPAALPKPHTCLPGQACHPSRPKLCQPRAQARLPKSAHVLQVRKLLAAAKLQPRLP